MSVKTAFYGKGRELSLIHMRAEDNVTVYADTGFRLTQMSKLDKYLKIIA